MAVFRFFLTIIHVGGTVGTARIASKHAPDLGKTKVVRPGNPPEFPRGSRSTLTGATLVGSSTRSVPVSLGLHS